MTIELKECFDELAVLIPMGVELIVIVILAILVHYYWHKGRTSSGYSAVEKCHVEGEGDAEVPSSRKDLRGQQRTTLRADDQRLAVEDEDNRTTHAAEVNELESKIKTLQGELDVALHAKHDEVESCISVPDKKLRLSENERLEDRCKKWQDVLNNAAGENEEMSSIILSNSLISSETRLKYQIQTLKQSLSAWEYQHKILQEQIDRVSQEKDDALSRLSENMAVQLTYENPNVTDLSDENRPNKLAERLSELYDNQYTDAQEILADKFKDSYSEDELTKKTAQSLLNMLQSAFAVCQESVEKQVNRLKHILTNPVAETETGFGEEQSGLEIALPKTLMKAFKDKRKTVKPDVSLLRQRTLLHLKQVSEPSFAETVDHEVVRKYIDESIKICWLMCIQDPPMHLEFSEMHDTNLRKFTQSGGKLEYYVWPSVYLHKDGSLMGKGVAQFSKRNDWENFD